MFSVNIGLSSGNLFSNSALDQKINDTGVKIDKALVHNAIKSGKAYQNKKMKETVTLTGLENPNSSAQLKGWIETNGIKVKSLSKEKVYQKKK
ncbi:hypothetical protein NL50_10425 [Clostridium acetobutylicum]|nr:hypothetical protein NL50_10425 [Clostridium acetobutylicum]